jgi:hypothetical protein
VDWKTAHQMAMLRAAQVLRGAGAEGSDYIDFFAVLAAAGVPCMAQPLDGLAGAYVGPASGGPAVMVNSDLGEVALRQTAAHEAGHHVFGHHDRLDERADPDHGTLGTPLPDEEKVAEAFATWLLMPRRAVLAAMRRAQVTRPATAADVHQVACWLGTSFAGTARHLVNLRLAGATQAAAWTREWHGRGPRIRAALAADPGSAPDRVWLIGPAADRAVLHVLPGDCLMCPGGYAPEQLPCGLRQRAQGQPVLEDRIPLDVTAALAGRSRLDLRGPDGCPPLALTFLSPPVRLGIDSAWQPRQPPSLPQEEP